MIKPTIDSKMQKFRDNANKVKTSYNVMEV